MKKIIILALCFTLAKNTKAQNNTKPNKGFKLGANTGLLICNAKQVGYTEGAINTEIALNETPKIGFKIGLTGSIGLTNRLSFLPEINFVQKNTSFSYKGSFFGTDISIRSTTKMNFLEIPLNFAYSFTSKEKGFFAGLGPVISLGLSGTQKVTINDEPERSVVIKFDGKAPTDSTGHLKPFDLGANIFLGYHVNENLNIRLMYNQSFTNLVTNPKGTFRLNYFGLSVLYNFSQYIFK